MIGVRYFIIVYTKELNSIFFDAAKFFSYV